MSALVMIMVMVMVDQLGLKKGGGDEDNDAKHKQAGFYSYD